jgi:hypothetical protein
MKDTALQASPEKVKKQQEDSDRAMKELLDENEKERQLLLPPAHRKN